MKPRFIAICAILALVPCAFAQRAGHASYHASFNSSSRFAAGRSSRAAGFNRRSPYTSLPFPLFSDAFSLEDLYSAGYPVASQPPVILMQAARAISDSDESRRSGYDRNPSSSEPLMIELQSGRYVQVNRSAVDGEALPLSFSGDSPDLNHAAHEVSSERKVSATSAQDVPPAILIFRDGHSEQVRDYTIAEGTLYARGNLYTDGYWTKKINLSTLDVQQTFQANASRNVKFVLPSSPNEVITRP